MDDADVREVIRLLQGLLKAVDNGELDGSTPNARALRRKLEGALIALELMVAPGTDTELLVNSSAEEPTQLDEANLQETRSVHEMALHDTDV